MTEFADAKEVGKSIHCLIRNPPVVRIQAAVSYEVFLAASASQAAHLGGGMGVGVL